MATFRITMIFRYATATGRTAGMSESWYKDNSTSDAALNALVAICDDRAKMLPENTAIVGQRVTQVDAAGASLSANLRFPGARAQDPQDIPQAAIQAKVQTAGRSRSKGFSLRMLADDDIVGGDLVVGAPLLAAIRAFGNELVAQGVSWRARRLGVRVRIVSIAADGTFEIEPGLTLAQNQYLTLIRCRNTAGRAVTGNFRIGTRTDDTHGKFSNWGGSTVGNAGFMRLLQYDYPTVGANPPINTVIQVIRSMVRKVGRPFDLYRGRATVRR